MSRSRMRSPAICRFTVLSPTTDHTLCVVRAWPLRRGAGRPAATPRRTPVAGVPSERPHAASPLDRFPFAPACARIHMEVDSFGTERLGCAPRS